MSKIIIGSIVAITGIIGCGAVSQASVWTIDSDGDGYSEGWLVDRWEDGSADIEAYDIDLNGVLDGYAFDTNNDGVHDILGTDPNENSVLNLVQVDSNFDGYFDVTVTDANENGVADSREAPAQASPGASVGLQGVAIVGPPTNPDGFYSLMMTMAAMTGQATFGSPDGDGDGYDDNEDYHPSDPFRY